MNILAKIAVRTVEKDGCTVWGGKHNHGHPQIWHEGKNHSVRRVLWAELHGPITRNTLVLMTCKTPGCIDAKCMRSADINEVTDQNFAESRARVVTTKPRVRKSRAKPAVEGSVARRISQHNVQREALGVWAGL